MPSKFTAPVRRKVADGVESGLTFKEAGAAAGVKHETLRHWLWRGRQEEGGDYAEFTALIEEVRETAQRRELSSKEFAGELARSVRAGSVQAMKLWWEINRERNSGEAEKPKGTEPDFDELAARRAA